MAQAMRRYGGVDMTGRIYKLGLISFFLAFFVVIAQADTSTTGGGRIIENPTQDGDLKIRINDGGVKKDVISATGSTALVTIGNSGETGRHTVNGALDVSGEINTDSGVFAMTGAAVNLWDLAAMPSGSAALVTCARAAGAGTKGFAFVNFDSANANLNQIVAGVTFSTSAKIIQATATNGFNLSCSYIRIQ